MCSRPRQLHFLTHSLSSVLVHATQSRSSACPAVSVSFSLSLFLYLSSSLAVLGSFSGRACLLFVCLIFTTLRMSAVSQSSISCHHLLNDGGGNSSSVWAAPATLLPSFSLWLCRRLILVLDPLENLASNVSVSFSFSIAIAIVVVVCRLHAHLRSILTSFSLLQLFVLLLWVY